MTWLTSTGGLHTSFQSLKANLLLSSGVALTGIAVPVGLSYTLQGLLDATPVQAFAAGAALCSTSLGTTFTVLGSSGLSSSRLGVVLTSAAMMDDVVGLVMVQVISNLGGENFSWVTVVRPVLVSVAFAVVVPILCLLVLKPVTLRLNSFREAHPATGLDSLLRKSHTAFAFHTALLIALVAGATYAGTSNLFAAYIAGATISWWDSELPHPVAQSSTPQTTVIEKDTTKEPGDAAQGPKPQSPVSNNTKDSIEPAPTTTRNTQGADSTVEEGSAPVPIPVLPDSDTSGAAIYHRYYHQAVSRILQPLFFASIGFSIPITRMFKGAIVWRGIVYTVLMAFAKFICGLWLVRFTTPPVKGNINRLLTKAKLLPAPHCQQTTQRTAPTPTTQTTTPDSTSSTVQSPETPQNHVSSSSNNSPNPAKPFSLHPPLILALAMCARGEIGFLISGVAESNGVFSKDGNADPANSSDIFLVVTWAIVLCTIIGPLGVGLSVRRVKKLQKRKEEREEGKGREVLGVWGVE